MEDQELWVMHQLVKLFEDLDESGRERALRWLNKRYGQHRGAEEQRILRGGGDEFLQPNVTLSNFKMKFDSVAELLQNIKPKSEGEKVLGVMYWLLVREGKQEVTAWEVNRTLKQVGKMVENITSAFAEVMKKEWGVQFSKKGSKKQGRKIYRMTERGRRRAEEWLGY